MESLIPRYYSSYTHPQVGNGALIPYLYLGGI
jgi:hypothetical protein